MRILFTTMALVALGSTAHADAPPPSGQKYVGYQFKVQGLGAEQQLVAWPWSLSNGSPTREYAVISDDTPVSVGRRSPTIQLFAVDKAKWQAFATERLGNQPPQTDEDRAALDAFLANAVRCNVHPNDQHVLPTSDPRDTIEELFVAKSVSPTSCVLEATPQPQPKSGCHGGPLGLGFGLASLALILRRGWLIA